MQQRCESGLWSDGPDRHRLTTNPIHTQAVALPSEVSPRPDRMPTGGQVYDRADE